jgi:type I restriction enzyme S subunit
MKTVEIKPVLTKPSGIPWLGEVPAHWEVKRLRFSAPLSNERIEADGEDIRPYVGMEHIESWTGQLLPLDDDFIPAGISNRMRPGQVLFGKLRPYLAKAWVTDRDGLCTTELMVLNAQQYQADFLRYLMLSDGFIKLVDSSTQGAKMPRADWEFVGNIALPLPPHPDPRARAAFLDERTARIDGLLARKRQLVQLLMEKRQALITRAVGQGLDPRVKLKDSGVPWLGEVPEGWEVKRFKHVVTVWGRIGFRGYTVDDLVDEGNGALALGASHITSDGGVDISEPVFLSWEKYYESPEIMIRKDDLIVVQRGSVGKVAHVDRDLGPATINPSLVLLKGAKANPRFLLYVLLGGYVQSTITTLLNATAVPMLSQQQIGNFDLLLPPREEQDAIVDFIDRETTRIDALVTKVEAAVERLMEYRTALISAAVTGKVRV